MKRFFKSSFALLMTAGLLMLCGCSVKNIVQKDTVFALDTVIDLTVCAPDRKALTGAETALLNWEKKFSAADENSEIGKLNGGDPAALSAETLELLLDAVAIAEETDGAFNPALKPVVSAWGFLNGDYRVPPEEEIRTLLPLTDYRQILISDGQVFLPEGQQIDLGGIAKGWIGKKLAEDLSEAGVRSALINLGGNIHAVGTKPDGSFWRIGIKDPSGDGVAGVYLAADEAVITSGGYERFFEQDGITYIHILDPDTGRPAGSDLLSATVIGGDGTRCDGLSTALFVMGREKAVDFWRNRGDFDMILIMKDRILITEGILDRFTPEGTDARSLEILTGSK